MFIFTGGALENLRWMFNIKAKLAIFDLCRDVDEKAYPFRFMEELKDGYFECGKYAGKIWDIAPKSLPVIVFTNNNNIEWEKHISKDRIKKFILYLLIITT